MHGSNGRPMTISKAKNIGDSQVAKRFILSAFLAAAGTTQAVEFENDIIEGNFDSTLSYGGSFRVDDPELSSIGRANGGTAYSVNGDDANLNYDSGLFSHVSKGTHDLELAFKELQDVSIFIRGTYFIDFENNSGDSPLSGSAKREVGREAELLDAYVSYDLPFSVPVNIRLGNQVLSWGESTFIQNGINIINPIDVRKFRVPGSELREALRPVPLLSASIQLTDNLSLEGFYQFKHEEMEIDPAGSYFSTKDFVGAGGQYAMLGFGSLSNPNMSSWIDNPLAPFLDGVPAKLPTISNPRFNPTLPPSAANAPFLPSNAGAIPRGKSNRASDSGQFGFAAHYFAEGLNDTEFGFYFLNYHSRLPLISAITGRDIQSEIQTNAVNPLSAGIDQLKAGIGQLEAGIGQAEAGLAQINESIAQLEANDPNNEGLVEGLKEIDGGVTVHHACHARAQNMGNKARDMLKLIPNVKIDVVERCAGHGGTFGVMRESHDLAIKVGRPTARQIKTKNNKYMASDCPLAGKHLKQLELDTNISNDEALHPIELLAKSYRL